MTNAIVLACLSAAGCAGGDGGPSAFDPDDVYRLDFIGELIAADTTGWQAAQREPSDEPVATTSGGPDSPLLVGPASLTLADGTVVTVPAGTPGGNRCPLLDLAQQPPDPPPGLGDGEVCVVLGVLAPGASSAAWFATEVWRRLPDGQLAAPAFFSDGGAVVGAGEGAFFPATVRADVQVGCGMTFADVLDDQDLGYTVTLDQAYAVSAIECQPTL